MRARLIAPAGIAGEVGEGCGAPGLAWSME